MALGRLLLLALGLWRMLEPDVACNLVHAAIVDGQVCLGHDILWSMAVF